MTERMFKLREACIYLDISEDEMLRFVDPGSICHCPTLVPVHFPKANNLKMRGCKWSQSQLNRFKRNPEKLLGHLETLRYLRISNPELISQMNSGNLIPSKHVKGLGDCLWLKSNLDRYLKEKKKNKPFSAEDLPF